MPFPHQNDDPLSSLLRAENNLETDLGAWFPGERVVFRGKDLFNELNDLPWMGLLLFGITGRLMSTEQTRLFEGMWSLSVSYPDPRLWNNRIAALAGTARSLGSLGVGAATAATEAKIYGGQANFGAIRFIKRAAVHYKNSPDTFPDFVIRELHDERVIPGFGRPIVSIDERIQPLMQLAKELGLHHGAHAKVVFEVERILIENRKRMKMNITGFAAALAADQGLSAREYSAYVIQAFGAGIVPCFLDATEKPVGCFFPLRCSRLRYEGPMERNWDEQT